ncbi:MAG: aspartate kinase, partial [Pseudomonadota bacterium]|nr:aspartate kinase [Pseudomonadota bacterium]
MALIVQKYGGTSVGDLERIKGVAQRIKRYTDLDNQVVVVVSAMSGETNRLIGLGTELAGGVPDAQEMDVLTSSGEQVAIALLSIALGNEGVPAKSMLAEQLGIYTDSSFGKARIEKIDLGPLKELLGSGTVPVVAGFQGVDDKGR